MSSDTYIHSDDSITEVEDSMPVASTNELWQHRTDVKIRGFENQLAQMEAKVRTVLDQMNQKVGELAQLIASGLVAEPQQAPQVLAPTPPVLATTPPVALKRQREPEVKAEPREKKAKTQNRSEGKTQTKTQTEFRCGFYTGDNASCKTEYFSRASHVRRHQLRIHFRPVPDGGPDHPGFCRQCNKFCTSSEVFVEHATHCPM